MTVVLGFDGSPAARAALEAAIEIARRFEERIVVVHGVGPPGASVGDEYRSHLQALEEMAGELTKEALERARAAGVEADAVFVRDRPAQALARVADESDARLIAVGTYGESPLRGAILGSTPHKLLHLSSRPVLVVPAPDGTG